MMHSVIRLRQQFLLNKCHISGNKLPLFSRLNNSIRFYTADSSSNAPKPTSPPSSNSTNKDTATSTNDDLSKFLAETIKSTGPISLASYMRQCLTNPSAGYYSNRDPFGAAGDFITSPEISQMFGELVGIWILTQWLAQGCPAKFRIVEFGPGRGTLMDDLLRAGRSFKDFSSALTDIYMIESSPTLRDIQRRLLCDDNSVLSTIGTGYKSTTKGGTPIFWFDNAKEIPREKNVPTFIIAHEFFDALPIFQFENTKDGWRERQVDYNIPNDESLLPGQSKVLASGSNEKPKFHLTVNPHWTPTSKIVPQTHKRYSDLPEGSKVEISPDAWDVANQLGSIVEHSGGAALIVDYGPSATIPVDSLRAIKNHKIVNPFENPGEADLSVDVDFQAIKIASMKDHEVDVYGPVMQGDWLHAMGIGARATQLANNKSDDEGKKRIEQAYNRLVEKSGGSMGKVYKAMCIVPRGGNEPVGFGGKVDGEEEEETQKSNTST